MRRFWFSLDEGDQVFFYIPVVFLVVCNVFPFIGIFFSGTVVSNSELNLKHDQPKHVVLPKFVTWQRDPINPSKRSTMKPNSRVRNLLCSIISVENNIFQSSISLFHKSRSVPPSSQPINIVKLKPYRFSHQLRAHLSDNRRTMDRLRMM